MNASGREEHDERFPVAAHLRPSGVEADVALARRWADAASGVPSDPGRGAGEDAGPTERSLPEGPPFSFLYGGRPSADVLAAWTVTREARELADGEQRQVTWHDEETGLECVLEMRTFAGFPAVEWVLRFRNTGAEDTPVLEDVRPLDMTWPADGDATLYRSLGSQCTASDFRYEAVPLPAGVTVSMAAGGGRSSNAWLPFFNLEASGGVILAIGWSGQWAADFVREDAAVRLRAGQELTRLVLHPGEEIRTPRIALLLWSGSRQAGHNAWRRFLLAHHTPRCDGQLLRGPMTVAHWGGMKSPDHLERIAAYQREGLEYDYYWVDAGWYGPPDSYSPDEFTGDWWKHVGNWGINPAAHPDGLRPISEAAAGAGMKFMLWFEPERAIAGTPLPEEHPEWFLGERKEGANLLLDLGNPRARQWLTAFVLRFVDEQGVHLYRQDFNFDPLPYWRAADAPDRQGMTEIRHVEGLYAFWDEVLASRPGLIIDNCSSGGRRIDLETISRSIPLWRSDWQCRADNDPIGGQTHGMGLSHWVPLHGTGTWSSMPKRGGDDAYRVRSHYGPAFQFSLFPYAHTPIRDDYPWDWHRRMLGEYRRARPLFYGDYYPLTPSSAAPETWAAYQMHRPDLGEGMVLAFRRPQSPYVSADFRLGGLDPEGSYELEDADSGQTWRQNGRELTERGLRPTMETAPASRLFFYRAVSE
ncbi:MAG TPA: alpha-galactosidase [Phycisphaerae bacterium]|nr:alpha-galactosidase [Phycisphaerae bacterium]